MAGALSWTLGLKDGMSGPGAAMGGVLNTIASKLRSAGDASDAFRKKQESAFRVAPRNVAAPKADARTFATTVGDVSKGDLAANMRKHDAAAYADVKRAADAATRAVEAYNKASSKASAGTLFSARSTMGKTGANTSGVTDGMRAPSVSGFAALIQKLSAIHPAAGRAAMGMASLAARADAATQSVGGLEGIAGKAGSALISVGAFALKAGAMAAGALAGIGIMAAKAIAEIHAFKQSTMLAFGALLGGADKATAAWDKVKAVSLSTGTSLMAVGGAFNSLLAQGFSLDEVDTLVKRMADLKTLNPAANIDGIARAISQIKSTGKLQGDELMQLNEAGLSSKLVYEELAKSLGKTVPEIQKMQKAGQITDTMAIDAIQKAIAKQTGGKAPGALAIEAANKTLSGSVGKMYAAVQVWASGLNIDFSALGRFADRLGKVLSGPAGKKLGSSIENAFARVLGILDTMSEKDISKGIEMAADAIDSFASGVQAAADAMRTVDGWVSSVSSKTSAWGIVFSVVRSGLAGIVDYFSMLGAAWGWLMEKAADLPMVTALGQLIDKISEAISKLSALGSMASTASSAFGLDLGAANTAKTGDQAPQQAQTDSLAEAIRKATAPPTPTAGAPGAPAAPGALPALPNDLKPGPKTTTISVTANGLTFEGFEQKVAEIVRAEMDKG